jgi:predicted acetyltransferase
MEIEIRACRSEDFVDFFRATAIAFGNHLSNDDLARLKQFEELDRAVCAVEDEKIVGTAGAFTFSVTVPGGELPAAGVTSVGVLPTHRRRGILSRMMRHQLADIHERGEPLAMLWASEGGIYRRYGYGLATLGAEIEIARDRAAFRRPPAPCGRPRLIDVEEAVRLLPPVYEQVRAQTPGAFARSEEWWREQRLADPEHSRRGGGPMFRVVIEREEGPVAYALYRLHPAWRKGVPAGSLEVLEAFATSPEATVELWRYLFGVDLVATVRSTTLPADHPLLQLVAEPARLRFGLQDALWLRVVDLTRALQGRSYAQRGVLTLGITDALCPWNEGSWRVEAGPGGCSVRPTGEEPDLALDIEDLGSVYLGGFTFGHLREAGLLQARDLSSVAKADSMFRTERAPFCPQTF